MMFAGEYLCKVDEKGRFIVPSPIRERLEAEGSQVIFLKGAEQSLWVYSVKEWEKVLERTKTTLDDDQSRLFMHFIVSEAGTSEIDKAGRILIPGRLRKLVPVDEDQEVILVGPLSPYGSLEPVRVAPLCGQDGNAVRRKHGQDFTTSFSRAGQPLRHFSSRRRPHLVLRSKTFRPDPFAETIRRWDRRHRMCATAQIGDA